MKQRKQRSGMRLGAADLERSYGLSFQFDDGASSSPPKQKRETENGPQNREREALVRPLIGLSVTNCELVSGIIKLLHLHRHLLPHHSVHRPLPLLLPHRHRLGPHLHGLNAKHNLRACSLVRHHHGCSEH